MTKTAKTIRLGLGRALVVGILVATIGLFGFYGPSRASAQADTTAPTISTIEITSATEHGVGVTIPYRAGSGHVLVRPSGPEGAYGIGDVIEVTVTFSESVTVSGAPQLKLDVGTLSKTAGYASSEGNSVVFTYTVTEGNSDTNGISIRVNQLTLDGGTIRDATNNDADLFYEALPDQENHKVDGIRPHISDIRFGSFVQHSSDGFYTAGELVAVKMYFTERVYVSLSGHAQITLDVGGVEKTVEWGNYWFGGFNEEWFEYRVQEGDLDLDGVSFGANAITLDGATVRDAAGNDAVLTHRAVHDGDFKVDAAVPTVSSIAITSDPGEDLTYGTGDKIEVTATFNENVWVPIVGRSDMPGLRWPQLELDIGGEAKTAEYQSVTGAEVVFDYTVRAGDTEDNGISIGANKLSLNGGAILDDAGNNPISAELNLAELPHDAVVPHDAVSDDAGHKVAGSPSSLTLSGDTSPEYEENGGGSVAAYKVSPSDATSWSLSGDDSGQFSISGGSWRGTLSFTSPPNYEEPTDADADNRYRVTIQASDGTNESTLQVIVLVTNVLFDADEVPVIIGTARVGETLTADTSGISDADQATFYYIWSRSDGTTDTLITDLTDVEGAEKSSYTLVAADEGHTIKVRVTSWSYGSDLVSLTSAPTAEVATRSNSPATGAPTISSTAQVGETLTADSSSIADADGLSGATFTYQWIRNDGTTDTDISGAMGATYTLVDADEGKTIKVRVTFTDDADNQETLTSAATAAVAARNNSPATGAPTISGTAQVGETLTADSSSIADADGLSGATFAHQWVRSDGTTDTDISGATGATYTLVDADEGKTIKVKVSFTDEQGNAESLTSDPTATVAAKPNSVATGAPTISGTAQVGETLTADTSGISDADGTDNVSYNHHWVRNDGSSDTDISGATSSTYTLGSADLGKTIKVRVSFTDDEGNAESLTSNATASVAAKPNTVASGAPTISGTAQVGETLTAGTSGITDADGLDNVSYSYQWVRSDGTDDTDISDATASTYTLVSADEGKTIKVKVSFTDDEGNSETLTSATTAAVAPPPNTDTLTASLNSAPKQHDGASAFNVRVLFSEDIDTAASSLPGAFTAENATLGAASKVDERSDLWEIEVTPTGDADVTLTLAVGQDCEEDHAPCTADDRQLGNTLTVTVPGPGSLVGFFDNAPISHDGENDFEVWVRFNRPITASSRKFPQAFETENGSVKATNRMDRRSDFWVLSVEPTGVEDVTLTLPGNRPCGEGGVPCAKTSDGEGRIPLSNSPTITIPGPNPIMVADASVEAGPDAAMTFTISLGRMTLTALTVDYRTVDGTATAGTDYTGVSGTLRFVIGEQSKTVTVQVLENDREEEDETFTLQLSDASRGYINSGKATGIITSPESTSNSPATGRPSVTGTAQVGETLTANTTGIGDADGLTNTSYSYQWIRSDGSTDTDIAGATASTYLLTTSEMGKAIKVRVSFTDEGGNDEVLTSAATGAVSPAIQMQVSNSLATGLPTISGTAQVGQTLTADTTGIDDANGLDNVSYSYQWVRNDGTDDEDVTGATSSTYTLVDADEDKTIKVKVSFTDDEDNAETLTSVATAKVSAAPALLTVSLTSKPASHNGSDTFTFDLRFSEEPRPGFSYKTLRDRAFTVTGGSVKRAGRMNRPSNISWRITIQPDGNGNVTAVLPVTTDCEVAGAVCTGDGRKLSSGFSVTVPGPNSPATGTPTIGGTAEVGQTLTAGTSGIADADGLTGVSYSYQWLADDADITGATASTYLLTTGEMGKAIKVKVSFTDDEGNAESLISPATGAVSPAIQQQQAPNTPTTGAPTISGTVQVGETLTADTSGISDDDGLDDVSFGYQWVRNDGSDDSDISDATGSTYTLVDDDEGKTIKVTASFTDDEDNDESVTSAATATVAAKPNTVATGAPTISGTAQVGETLTADTSGIGDADGLGNVSYSHQWIRNDGTVDTDISGATGSTYTLVPADEGKMIKVKASFTDDEGNDETLTSAATGSVAAKPNTAATGAPTINGTAQVGETLAADTSGVADDDGLENVSYNYQWVRNDGTDDVDLSDATGITYTLVKDDEGDTIKVRVSFTDEGGNDEALTSAATAAVAAKPNTAATGSPAISGTAQVGETLTADTSGIEDADGLDNVSYSYQWVRNDGAADTDIANATGSTYALMAEDQGKSIKVRVSFTDDEDNAETLTSAATGSVEAATGDIPVWSTTMTTAQSYTGQGYSGFDGFRVGSLTETSFEIDDVTYTVNLVEALGWVYIGLDKEMPIAFTLDVDETRFQSGDASFTSYTYSKIYKWDDAQINWSEGDSVQLRLYRSSENSE